MQVDHLHGGELLEHASRREPGCQAVQAPPQLGQERDEDVGLYAGLLLMEDRPNGEITFEILERFFHRDQLEIVAPQLRRVVLAEVGAQQISALAPTRLSETNQQRDAQGH